MNSYTEVLESIAKGNLPGEHDYSPEKLMEVVKNFRSFSELLTDFIVEHGYSDDTNDNIKKAAFLENKFKDANIPMPKTITKWFEGMRIEKPTPFLICFAFLLNLKETEEFFRKVCLIRGIDCHRVDDAVYYFCIKNKLTYQDARSIIDSVPSPSQSGIIYNNKEVMYTATIIKEIDIIKDISGLKLFLKENIDYFSYNNASATKNIRFMWEQIRGSKGLACRERALIEENEREEDKPAKFVPGLSDWEIYKQILGFDKEEMSVLNESRSIKTILKNNVLIHPLAEDSFPARKTISNIISGKHTSDESVRKTVILLAFYRYWCRKKIETGEYYSIENDAKRCIAEINKYLTESGFSELYFGNPFDWIFMFSMLDEAPLTAFRDFMYVLYNVANEELEIKE